MKTNHLGSLVLCAIAILSMNSTVAQADTAYSNKWRIEVSEGANASGTMTLRVTPSQGSPTGCYGAGSGRSWRKWRGARYT